MRESVDVLSVGEVLIDFISKEKTGVLAASDNFIKSPGGAPANVAVGVKRLGASSGFMGKVGNDPWGHYLKAMLEEENVNTQGVVFDEKAKTTITFVTVALSGERDFSFYRNPGADMMFRLEEINEELIEDSNIVHFGSVSLSQEPGRTTTMEIIKMSKKMGKIISFDPNIRIPLWRDKEQIKKMVFKAMPYADIVKISDEEGKFLFDTEDMEKAADRIMEFGVKLVLITCGGEGCYYKNNSGQGFFKGYKVKVADTTGAGDSFVSGVLAKIIQGKYQYIDKISKEEMEDIINYANATAAITVSRPGAIPAMPKKAEVLEFINNYKKI